MLDNDGMVQGAKILKRPWCTAVPKQAVCIPGTTLWIDPEDVIGYDALWESKERCKRGVIWKGSVAHFYMNAPEEVYKLSQELYDGTYTPRPPVHFKVKRPKPRDIIGIPFRDRVVQRSFTDNVIYQGMSRDWIYDNYACQEGKGTDFARNRIKAHLQRFYRRYGLDGYMLKADIFGYYRHLLYSVMFDNFRRKCPAFAADFAEFTIRSQYTLNGSDRGVEPGSHLIQIAGIDYLNRMDHFIKEKLHIKYYGRYMDDFILMHQEYDYLVYCREQLSYLLEDIGLMFHPKKTHIKPIYNRFEFLGFNTVLLPDGRVLRSIKGKSIRDTKRRVSKIYKVEQRDNRTREATDASYEGWRVHASKGNSHMLLEEMDEWYDILREDDYAYN